MTAVPLTFGGVSRCRYAITWTGNRIHRRYGRGLWCDQTRRHAGPPWPALLTGSNRWLRCERCFP